MSATRDVRAAADATLARAAAFNAAAVAAATATTPQAFLDDALGQLARLLGITACAILVESESGLRCASAVGVERGTAERAGEHRLPDGFRSRWSAPLALADGRTLGWLVAYGRGTSEPDTAMRELAAAYGSVIALGLDRVGRQSGLSARYQAVVAALTGALDARDEYTGGHSTETLCLAERVASRLGVSTVEMELVSQVAVLHDVGKLGIPTHVLLKPGPLDPDEQALMREHPVIGQRILNGIPELSEVATAIRCEHERWDGGGYPDGLAGEQIPLASRIVFACDAWHAMTSDRPYRPAMDRADALRELREHAGSQFDPRVAQALLEILGEGARPVASSPSESRDEAVTSELTRIAGELGAEDLFVFRRVTGGLYSHLGGVGRGAGWAGNIELDSGEEHHLRAAIAGGTVIAVDLDQSGRIVGPYYGRSAVVVPCVGDSIVVFGSASRAVATAGCERATWLAERARALVLDVSPAKRLADELEVLTAVREVTTVNAESVTEALSMLASRVRNALSAEYALVAALPSGGAEAAVGISAGAWQPQSRTAVARAVARVAGEADQLPLLSQDVAGMSDPFVGFAQADGVSSIHVLPIGSPALAVMLVVHAEPGLRGFTDLCQRVAAAMADAAELVVRRALAEERLRAENVRLSERIRTDALTGVASRSAWEDALRSHQLNPDSAPLSVVIVDVDGLKPVNDQLGHAAGDDLLRRCARELANSVGLADLVARIGGDEFGVLLRFADEAQAKAWCERVDHRLRAHGGPELSLSLGYASVPPEGSIAEAVDEADRRMYERKLGNRAARG